MLVAVCDGKITSELLHSDKTGWETRKAKIIVALDEMFGNGHLEVSDTNFLLKQTKLKPL